jgi:hypothetical protein
LRKVGVHEFILRKVGVHEFNEVAGNSWCSEWWVSIRLLLSRRPELQ